VTLIKEINDLRRELSQSRSRVHDLETTLGVHRNTGRAAAAAVDASSTGNNAVMQLQLEEKSKVVELQRTEIMRLRSQLMDMERPASAAVSRPSSAARLPPMPVGAQ